jgi:hypothetical protein
MVVGDLTHRSREERTSCRAGFLLLPLPLEDFQGPRGLDSLAASEKASALAGSPSPDLSLPTSNLEIVHAFQGQEETR